MSSAKIALTAAVACFLLAFVVPTVAITVAEDTASDDVVLEPTSQYASIQGEKLQLDLEKLNDRAITTADDVFAISINDDGIERVWIEGLEGLEFYEGNDPSAEITESNPLEPSAGDTVHVGVAVDTHVAHADTETFTVHVAYDDEGSGGGGEPDDGSDWNDTPKGVSLESLTVEPRMVDAGDAVTVTATYRNRGRETKRHAAALTVDGTVVETKMVAIEPGGSRTVTFERVMQWAGSYDVGVGGAASERVTVAGASAEVLEAGVTDAELTAGERTTISATVRNPTDERIQRTLELAVDGIVVDTRTVAVDPGGERTVTFERQFDDPGTYAVAVSGVDAGSVTVSEPDHFSLRNRTLSAATTAALAPPLATGLLFLGAAANRRWSLVPGR